MKDEFNIDLSLPNGLLYVIDAEMFDPPEIDGSHFVYRSESCLILVCQPDMDGPTAIRINSSEEPRADLLKIGSFIQSVPSGRLALMIVPGEIIHEVPVGTSVAQVDVWTTGFAGTPRVWLKIQ